MFKSLLEHGANPTSADEDGNWAIHEAASDGDTTSIKALLSNDPRFKGKEALVAKSKGGEAPLVLAVRSHQPDAVSYIVDRGKVLYGSDFLEYYGNAALDEALTLRSASSRVLDAPASALAHATPTGNLVIPLGLVNYLGVLRCGLKQGGLVETVIPDGLRVAVAFHELLACQDNAHEAWSFGCGAHIAA